MSRRGMVVTAVVVGCAVAVVVAVPVIVSQHKSTEVRDLVSRARASDVVDPPAGTAPWDAAHAADRAEERAWLARTKDPAWGELATAWSHVAQSRDLLAMAADADPSSTDAERASYAAKAGSPDPAAFVAVVRSECAKTASRA